MLNGTVPGRNCTEWFVQKGDISEGWGARVPNGKVPGRNCREWLAQKGDIFEGWGTRMPNGGGCMHNGTVLGRNYR